MVDGGGGAGERMKQMKGVIKTMSNKCIHGQNNLINGERIKGKDIRKSNHIKQLFHVCSYCKLQSILQSKQEIEFSRSNYIKFVSFLCFGFLDLKCYLLKQSKSNCKDVNIYGRTCSKRRKNERIKETKLMQLNR